METDPHALAELGEFLDQARFQRAILFRPTQKQHHFVEAGGIYRKRCMMAANQVGKSEILAFEIRCHTTGLYPDWWRGRRFHSAVRCWVGGPDAMHVRDNMQRKLFGPDLDENIGTGTIEKHLIKKAQRQSGGVQNALDYASILHKSGGLSFLKMKSYDQDLQKWSGETLHFVAYDEEPPWDHFAEGLTRTNYGDSGRPGMVMIAMTPLLGMSKVARTFYPFPRESDSALITMGLRDATQYREEDREAIAKSYPEHERRARVEGKPQLGEGAVFPIDFEKVMIDPPERMRWWLCIGGLDFGGAGHGSHPSAAVEIGWDREADVIYVLREHRMAGMTIAEFCSPLRHWSPGHDTRLPFAWPHDAHRTGDQTSGATMRALHEREGLLLLDEHAQKFSSGHYTGKAGYRGSLEESVAELSERFATRRLLISRACTMLREELEGYRRERGRIVKEYDDLIAALRYAVMAKEMGVAQWNTSPRDRIQIVGLDRDPLDF